MDRNIPYHYMSKLRFSAYSCSEIVKLSVVEVTNPETVDVLGHPSKKGLHDPALGPNTNKDLCATCGLNSVSCPGHIGHISLPLPVYNPFFFNTLYKLLKGSCFKCHCLLAPEVACHLLLGQLQALDHGLVGLSEELRQIVADVQDGEEKSMHTVIVIEKLSKVIQDALDSIDSEEAVKSAHVKNVVECKQKIIKQFLKNFLAKGSRTCPRCRSSQPGLATYNNTKIVFTSKSRSQQSTSKLKNANKAPIPSMDAVDGISMTDLQEDNPATQEDLNSQKFLTPMEARIHLRQLWANEGTLLHRLYGSVCNNVEYTDSPADIFFLDLVPVPASKFRPMSFLNGMITENPQTANLKQVLKYSIVVRSLIHRIKNASTTDSATQTFDEHVKMLIEKLPGKSLNEKMNSAWLQLQTVVNCVLDSDLDKLKKVTHPGVKQVLEKKEGLFRKHMMGKRVNYAARSVISPDPYITINEIGVPHVFATKLTYPQPVTPWNVQELKQMVINGPDVYPGASLVKNEDGSSVKLMANNQKQREAVAKQLLTPTDPLNKEHRIKTVYRHLINGDVLLLNRQPTLHKPSIMAHKARILPGEKTLRLHYATCKCYNADFDGDEMNAHFPQSEHGRAEAYTLALVDHQYVVPKDGTPLSGLIQDHVVSGTLMTIRGQFFNKDDYHELVYAALTFKNTAIKTLPPSIQKPQRLWSGKQIISTVIMNVIPENKSLVNLNGKSKTSVKNWNVATPRKWNAGGTKLEGLTMSESEVIVRAGELLCGVLDKAHYGSSQYGLVHCCNELYGGSTTVMLLTSFARLFTYYLQFRGFTLGIEDIIVVPKADKKRRKLMKSSTKVGDKYAAKALNLPEFVDKDMLVKKLREAQFSRNDLHSKQLDMTIKEATDNFNNEINSACLPEGLLKKFPHNNLQLMVQSGAKGSTVNTMQISGLLGQIELEGRRPPLMISGHSLPSFLAYETSPRAGGFVTGRFLSGIRPQEYFFHCMAGREGLIDTAVKTSRSGYLQRCLIKHLEGISVNYDLTVRDSDGSVIQFFYGDDGLDIPKTQFLKPSQMPFLGENVEAILDVEQMDKVKSLTKLKKISKLKKKVKKFNSRTRPKHISASNKFRHFSQNQSSATDDSLKMNFKTGRTLLAEKICQDWRDLDEESRAQFHKYKERCPDPAVNCFRPDRSFSSVTEKIDGLITDYLKEHGENLRVDVEDFKDMCYMKSMRALCEPGESVGLLAAQSVGEPSTQMTLNTFHFAGRGEMNVTLGIPRLREILMVASANIATPSMVVPVLPNAVEDAQKLRLQLNKIYLNQLLEHVSVKETIHIKSRTNKFRKYNLMFKFLPYKLYKENFNSKPSNNLQFMEKCFLKILCNAIKKKFSTMSETKFVSVRSRNVAEKQSENEEIPEMSTAPDDEGNSSDEDAPGEDDTTSTKMKSRHDQEQEYDEPDDDAEALSDDSDDEEIVKTEPIDDEEDVDEVDKKNSIEAGLESMKSQRVQDALQVHEWIVAYNFDTKKEEWCEVTLKFELGCSKFDISSLVEEEAKRAIVHQVPNINKALLSPIDEPDLRLTVDGINITEMFKYGHILDLNKLYSNHIHAIANCYGIEAARTVIVKEVVNVFAVYGIEVDLRHLSLIADYMTFEGSYKPFNRIGIESSASPIQQMTFETTLQFLKSAALFGYEDQLKSPSSRLVVGKIVGSGTGSFELLQKPYSADLIQSSVCKNFSRIKSEPER